METLIRKTLQGVVQSNNEEYTAEDMLRSFAHQAQQMFRTDETVRTLTMDPYRHLGEIQPAVQRLCRILQVTEYEKILTPTGYCRILATVQLPSDETMAKVGVEKYVELYFHFERETHHVMHDADRNTNNNETHTTTVWYSIDVARDDGPKEKILWVKVFGTGQAPSSLPAKNIDEDNADDDKDGGWEDIEDEGDNEEEEMPSPPESKFKKARIETDGDKVKKDNQHGKEEETNKEELKDDQEALADHFTAGIDPDALERFLHWSCLDSMNDDKAFFLLMSFNFYEMEYDLVGFILDAVFGPDEEGEASDQDDD